MESIENIVRPAAQQDFAELYESAFPAVAAWIGKMNGSFEDAKDIFHDALVVYFEKANDLQFYHSPEAYLMGIAKHLWMRRFRKNRPSIAWTDFELSLSIPDQLHPDVDTARLLQFLETTGKRCMDLLRSVYYKDLTFAAIAPLLGYSSEHSAAAQKYKCIEKLRNVIKQKSLAHEDFLE